MGVGAGDGSLQHERGLQEGAIGVVGSVAEGDFFVVVQAEAQGEVVVPVGSRCIRLNGGRIAHFLGAVSFLLHISTPYQLDGENEIAFCGRSV